MMASVAKKDGIRHKEDNNREQRRIVGAVEDRLNLHNHDNRVNRDHHVEENEAKIGSSCSSGSDSSSTEEEERLRRLFQACDRDCDGFIDSEDLQYMCQQLGMEDSVEEIMLQLGGGHADGRISFEEFSSCRMQLLNEIEEERGRETSYHHRILGHDEQITEVHGGYIRPPGASLRVKLPVACTQESKTLHQLLELHHPDVIPHTRDPPCVHLLQLANDLHLAALSSLKGEIIQLGSNLQHVTTEKDHLEKQLSKQQGEKIRQQREYESSLEQQTLRHEERIIELHSVIAELRKKLDRHQINVIREEDEYEDSDGANSNSNRSNEDVSVNENNPNDSQTASQADPSQSQLVIDLTGVTVELEQAIGASRRINQQAESADRVSHFMQQSTNKVVSAEEKAVQVCQSTTTAMRITEDDQNVSNSSTSEKNANSPASSRRHGRLHHQQQEHQHLAAVAAEVAARLQEEKSGLQDQVAKQETDLNRLRAQFGSQCLESDQLKRKVKDLQGRLHEACSLEGSSPHRSQSSTPTKSALMQASSAKRSLGGASCTEAPVTKVAELKKLKTSSSEKQQILGAEISQVGVNNYKVAEHLVQSVQDGSSTQEMLQTLNQCGNKVSENRIQEFEIEKERLQSKIDHIKSQNDLLTLTLEESKAHCDRMSVLIGKYESNNTILHLALSFSDQAHEAYEALNSLLQTDKQLHLANSQQGFGLSGDYGDTSGSGQEELAEISRVAQRARRSSEHTAKQLLNRLERGGTASTGQQASHNPPPWEDLSSTSRTASTTSSTGSSVDGEFLPVDEQRLREHITTLKQERLAVQSTMMALESVHIDPLDTRPHPPPDAGYLDLENAVLMQELMALKEEKAELKAHNYMLEKEKAVVELQLNSKESQEKAYRVQIEHLKSETSELQQYLGKGQPAIAEDGTQPTPPITLAELRSVEGGTEIASDLQEALKRERRLKQRVQELIHTLEKLAHNSEIRHQQSAEFVNDLKRANGALVSAFEKAKKKYQGKIKKMELQMGAMGQRYEMQVKILNQRISYLEQQMMQSYPSTSETSL